MPWILFKLYAHTLCIGLVFYTSRKKHERGINFKKVYSETLGYLLVPKCKEGTLETTSTPARLALFHNFFKYSLYQDIHQAVLYCCCCER